MKRIIGGILIGVGVCAIIAGFCAFSYLSCRGMIVDDHGFEGIVKGAVMKPLER